MRVSILEIQKEECTFSAGHFTIFSATDREQMHGHNYAVSVAFKFSILATGISFDYRIYKKKIIDLCSTLNRFFLLPNQSPYLEIKEEDDYIIALFNGKKIPFLKEDVVLLPLANITIEELAHWFLQKLIEEKEQLHAHRIEAVRVKVFNGPGQGSDAVWGEM